MSKVKIHGKAIKRQPVLIHGNGNVFFAANVRLGYFPSPFFFSGYIYMDLRGESSRIEIGENSVLNNNANLIADETSIIIKKKCLIGPNFTIFTSDFHALDPDERLTSNYPKLPVIIGENVFIGANVTILKGVEIGDNSVIASGSIVVKSIPSNVIAGGNPCRILKSLN